MNSYAPQAYRRLLQTLCSRPACHTHSCETCSLKRTHLNKARNQKTTAVIYVYRVRWASFGYLPAASLVMLDTLRYIPIRLTISYRLNSRIMATLYHLVPPYPLGVSSIDHRAVNATLIC